MAEGEQNQDDRLSLGKKGVHFKPGVIINIVKDGFSAFLTASLAPYTIRPSEIDDRRKKPTNMTHSDEGYMRESLNEAHAAFNLGEVPVGCVAVHQGAVIARAHNRRETWTDPTAHAEMLVLREAARKLGKWRLNEVSLYVTLEPCSMCAGALVLARIDGLVYGCKDPTAGACGSVFDILREPRLNHRIEVKSGVLESECQSVLKDFFEGRRLDK